MLMRIENVGSMVCQAPHDAPVPVVVRYGVKHLNRGRRGTACRALLLWWLTSNGPGNYPAPLQDH